MRQCVWHKFIPLKLKLILKMISQYFFLLFGLKKQLKNLALSLREVVEILELDKTNIKLGFKTVE